MLPSLNRWVVMQCITPTLFALGFLWTPLLTGLHAQCPMTCLGQTNLSLGPDGQALFTPAEGLSNVQPACLPDYSVALFDVYGTPVPNPVDCGQRDRLLTFVVTYEPNGNSCWGQVRIEDKLPPVLQCSGAVIPCTLSPDSVSLAQRQASDNCDPQPQILLTHEEYRDLGCNGPSLLVLELERHWIARDASGNDSAPCVQVIQVQRATLNDLQFPADKTGSAAISCSSPDADPSITGYPLLFGGANTPWCKILFTYEDDTLSTCPGGYRIEREWTALDCCTSELLTAVQVIEVADMTPPLIACPPDLTISTREDTCAADFTLPLATATDACSPTISYQINTSWGGSGPGPYTLIGMGGYKVHYSATDACGNTANCTIDLTIKDLVPPLALCRTPIIAYLDALGKDTIRVSDVDAGSVDNCGMSMGQIKRMQEPDSLFRNEIVVDCSHIGTTDMLVLRMTDCWDNTAICMTILQVADTLPPLLQCPPSPIFDCTIFAEYPDIGGVAVAADNCSGHTLDFEDQLLVNDCGVGNLERVWTATDTYGNQVSCIQLIQFIDQTPPSVQWPADITINCFDSLDPSVAGEPLADDDCSLLAVGYVDSLILVDNACDTLYRIWRVKDWCTDFDTTHIQRINLLDGVPVFTIICPQDVTIYPDVACAAEVSLPPVQTLDECAIYALISNDSPFADEPGANASGQYPLGEHIITFSIRYACNQTTCTTVVSVLDSIPPLLVCNDVVECLLIDGTYTLNPASMVVQAVDLCGPVTLEASQTIFGCDDILQSIPITITATDPFGNSSACEKILFLIDCDENCDGNFTGGGITLSGKVHFPDGVSPAPSGIQFTFPWHQKEVTTQSNGAYLSPPFPKGIDVAVSGSPLPGSLDNLSTGDVLAISAHLLGIAPISNPLALLAADVNFSGTISVADLVALRKSILRQSPVAHSGAWRPVPLSWLSSGQEIAQSPLFWEAAYDLQKVTDSRSDLDFTLVQVGDIDGSGQLQGEEEWGLRYLDMLPAWGQLRPGEQIQMHFQAADIDQLVGWQFAFGYPAHLLRLEGWQSRGLPSLGAEHLWADEPGILRCSWDDIQQRGATDTARLFSLTFTLLADPGTAPLLWLETRDLPATCYFREGGKAALALRTRERPGPPASLGLRAEPNPFRSSTRLSFDLPEAGPVTLTLFAANGQPAWELRQILPAGRQYWDIPGGALPGAGVYHAQIRTTRGVWTLPLTLLGH